MTWGAILAIVSALGTGGVFAAIFKWITDRPQNKAQSEEIWRRMNSTALQDAESKTAVQGRELRLVEFKFDLLVDLFSESIELMNLPQEGKRALRQKFMMIKYLEKVEDHNP